MHNMALTSSLIAKNLIFSLLKQNEEMELFVFVHLDLSGLFLNSMFSYSIFVSTTFKGMYHINTPFTNKYATAIRRETNDPAGISDYC